MNSLSPLKVLTFLASVLKTAADQLPLMIRILQHIKPRQFAARIAILNATHCLPAVDTNTKMVCSECHHGNNADCPSGQECVSRGTLPYYTCYDPLPSAKCNQDSESRGFPFAPEPDAAATVSLEDAELETSESCGLPLLAGWICGRWPRGDSSCECLLGLPPVTVETVRRHPFGHPSNVCRACSVDLHRRHGHGTGTSELVLKSAVEWVHSRMDLKEETNT
ncbi:hypothetical protein B0H19DRAFT_1065447 [Mycena capillaripes]|nr:hypothetical protein B0H19DRAFT_1065447 [Mycena capillaripes]